MIQANEVRIGNFLRYGASFDKVSSISEDEGDYKISCKGFSSGRIIEFEPIPLTPALLEKCGFKIMRFNSKINGNEWIVAERECCCIQSQLNNREYFLRVSFDHDVEEDSILFTSLHQLQNIYFALTGKELEVNI